MNRHSIFDPSAEPSVFLSTVPPNASITIWRYTSWKMFGVFIYLLLRLYGCAMNPSLPASLGERQSSYSYIPLDPLPVTISRGVNCDNDNTLFKPILDCLPDQAVRIAVGQYEASGTIVFGPAKVGSQGNSYLIILDYISVDAANVPVYIERTLADYSDIVYRRPDGSISVFDDRIEAPTQYRIYSDPEYYQNSTASYIPNGDKVIIPVYVGVGLRLTASVTVSKGTANLSSLGSIAADAEAGKITGSLIVQTLGITGKSVSTVLPLPSELNQTTIQNAILALGSIKAILYDKNTQINPRVVGIYNPVGGGQQVVNGIISILSSDPIRWYRPCCNTGKEGDENQE